MSTLYYRDGKYHSKKLPKREPSPPPEIVCPSCEFKFVPQITINDGGSKCCPKCSSHFHYSPDGSPHVGSPGPAFCQKCEDYEFKNKNKKDLLSGTCYEAYPSRSKIRKHIKISFL